jgi:hypothetical protein
MKLLYFYIEKEIKINMKWMQVRLPLRNVKKAKVKNKLRNIKIKF